MKASWAGHERVLYRRARVYAPGAPFATALLIDGDTIAWIGDEAAAGAYADVADVVVECEDALITPGFVDAHVHATATGLTLTGLDLRGYRRRADVVGAIQAWAQQHAGATMIGHGWDETDWDDPRPLTRQEIDRATWGSVVFLSRVDVHAAVVSSALLATMPHLKALPGFDPDGVLRREAVKVARDEVFRGLSASQRGAAQAAFLDHAAACGIVAVHEMAGPSLSSVEDAQMLVACSHAEPRPIVGLYWGEMSAHGGIERAQSLGAIGAGGDLFVDGSIGSRTACLHEPYLDEPNSRGVLYLSEKEITDHVIACTAAGLQAGFHVIGDAAMSAVVAGFEHAVHTCGVDAVRASRHRLEHAEMMTTAHRSVLAALAITVSMQPNFDRLWGGAHGMYAERLGVERSAHLNQFADVVRDGLPLAFGSDSPVTSMSPWPAVHAATMHPSAPISSRAAFHAYSRGGWRAIGQDGVGVIEPGAPAHLAVWRDVTYAESGTDDRVSRWSTDPRSGTPDLPDLAVAMPRCVRTLVDGAVIWDAGEL